MTTSSKTGLVLATSPTDEPAIIPEGGLPPSLISIFDIIDTPPSHEDTLLGERWLCKGGAALLIGPSGIGKSSASMQMDLCWAAGREAFGIRPARPLRIVTIQAENDRGDLHEMGKGVLRGMGFTESEQEQIRTNHFLVFEHSRTGAVFIDSVVAPILEAHRPDIIRIDPLSAYAGADMTQADKSAAFLRAQLNPLLKDYGCGLMLVHHTPKTTGRDTSKWTHSDWSYAGAGSADIVNWARAMLVINPGHEMGAHRFIAAKRGGRIGWKSEDGEKCYEKWFQHSADSYFCWEETDAPLFTGKPPKHTVEDVWPHVPLLPEKISKAVLLTKINDTGIGKESARGYINKLIQSGDLVVEKVKRSGTNAAVFLERAPHVQKPYRNAEKGALVTIIAPAERDGSTGKQAA